VRRKQFNEVRMEEYCGKKERGSGKGAEGSYAKRGGMLIGARGLGGEQEILKNDKKYEEIHGDVEKLGQ
jgi:hypothetical protein